MKRASDFPNFRALFEDCPQAMLLADLGAPLHPVIAVNPAFSAAFNVPTDRLLGRPIAQAYEPFLTQDSSDTALLLLQQSIHQALTTGMFDTVQVALSVADVHPAIWQLRHSILPATDDQRSLFVQFAQPSSAMAAVENAPTAPSDDLRLERAAGSPFEYALQGYALLDLEGNILDCNNALASLIGINAEELKTRKLDELIHPDELDRRRQLMQRLLTREIPAFVQEARYCRPEATDVWTRSSVSLLLDEQHQPWRIVSISEETTQRRLAEKALMQTGNLAAMGRLSASIAHELNNPLESVTNLLFLISHSENLDEVRRYSHLAEQELARVSRITTQTLRYYRPQAAPSPVHLADVLESVLALFEGRIRNEKVRIKHDCRPGAQPLIAYSGELRQVFVNLVGNALDAMSDNGSLRIIIRPASTWKHPPVHGVRVTICDNGTGIPSHLLQKVFEPFVSTKESRGTGLGLWISKDIVHRHGGTLRVRSCTAPGPNRGTSMCVFLPTAPIQQIAAA